MLYLLKNLVTCGHISFQLKLMKIFSYHISHYLIILILYSFNFKYKLKIFKKKKGLIILKKKEMNSSNSSSLTDSVLAIFGYYIVPVTALTNSLAYIACVLVLCNIKLFNQTKYSLLFCKVINVTLISILFIGYQNNSCTYCPDRIYNTYISQAYSLYCLKFIFHVFGMSHVLIDLLMAYDRFCQLRNIKSFMFNMPTKYLYLVTFIVPILLRLPDYFARRIEYSVEKTAFYIVHTPVGKASWYIFYKVALNLVFYGVCITVFSIITIINITDYKQWAYNKSKMFENKIEKQKIKQSEAAFTRMVTYSNIIGAAAIVYNLIAFILVEISTSNKGIRTPNTLAYLNQTVSYELIFVAWLVDLYLYLSIDKNFRNFVSKMFPLRKKLSTRSSIDNSINSSNK